MNVSAITLSFSFGLALLAVLGGDLHFWSPLGPQLSSAARYGLALAFLTFCSALLLSRYRGEKLRLDPAGLLLAVALTLLTSFICTPYALLKGPAIRGEIVLFGLISLLVPTKSWTSILRISAVLALLFLLSIIPIRGGSEFLFSDDHPAVIYRLQLLLENFPNIPFYNPQWNGGIDARDFFATGILNVFFIFWPILKIWGVFNSYNLIVSLILFVLLPISSYLAARIENLSVSARYIAPLLAISSSLLWYRWALKYGSLGFVCAAALFPVALAITSKILDKDRSLSKFEAILGLFAISLMLCWSLTGLAFIPAVLLALSQLPRLFKTKLYRRLILGLLAINIPWILMFLSVSQVGTFLKLEKPSVEMRENETKIVRGDGGHFSAAQFIKSAREFSSKANPLLVFLIPAGLLALPFIASRRLYSLVTLWLLLLGLVVSPLKPQLELDRMLVLFAITAAVPVAAVAAEFLRRSRWTAAITIGILGSGVFAVSSVLYDRSIEHYTFSSPLVRNIVQAIKSENSPGRVAFAGFILHDLNTGHIAPLASLSGKALVASTPFHNVWWWTELIPEAYRSREQAGIEEYFDLLNVSSVFAHNAQWQEYFNKHPELYKKTWAEDRFQLFKRLNYRGHLALSGQARLVNENSSGITIEAQTAELVLPYKYFPFLKSSACEIAADNSHPDLSLIKLTGCPLKQEIRIESVSPWRRLVG